MSTEDETRTSLNDANVSSTRRAWELFFHSRKPLYVVIVILACSNYLLFQRSQYQIMKPLYQHHSKNVKNEAETINLEEDAEKNILDKLRLVDKLIEKSQAKVPEDIERKASESIEDEKKPLHSETVESKKTGEKTGVQDKESGMVDDKSSEKKKRMNVLLLYADDWTSKTLGAAGNKIVKTPVLDDLASKGIRFPQNCVTTSICWVSRATLFTGLYMARHNTTMPSQFFVAWAETIYDIFMKSGYSVANVGKWGVWSMKGQKVDFEAPEDGWHIRKFGNKLWHITEKNEADALRYLKEKRDKSKPFFLQVSFFATHAVDGDSRQYMPQSKSMSLYQNVTIPMPVTATQEAWEKMPYFFKSQNEGRIRWRWRFETRAKHQRMMKNYYRMASEVDTACGAILEELRQQNELDNTFIIFTTDNGNFHAEHGLADKWYPHQESIQVPLIIVDPRMTDEQKGTTNDEFTLNIDLAPTLLSAANIQPLPQMQGRNIAELYLPEASSTEPETPWRKEFFYEHPQINSKDFIPSSEALVRKDFKYFFWPDFKFEQLFNIKEDPYEEHDLFNSAAHQKQLKSMRKRFLELKTKAHSSEYVTL